VNSLAVVDAEVPVGPVTCTPTTPTVFTGDVTVIDVSDTTVNDDAVALPNVTSVAPVKPVPVNVTDVPPAVGPDGGVTAVTEGGGATTVKTAVPETPDTVPVIVVCPSPFAVARPPETLPLDWAARLEMVAMDVDELVHVAWSVRSSVLLSENVAVAMNCCVFPNATLGPAGLMEMLSRVGLTLNPCVPVTPSNVALTVVDPIATPVTTPLDGPTVAVDAAAVVHADCVVTSTSDPSEYTPMALNC
jgi:hypothetical protein